MPLRPRTLPYQDGYVYFPFSLQRHKLRASTSSPSLIQIKSVVIIITRLPPPLFLVTLRVILLTTRTHGVEKEPKSPRRTLNSWSKQQESNQPSEKISQLQMSSLPRKRIEKQLHSKLKIYHTPTLLLNNLKLDSKLLLVVSGIRGRFIRRKLCLGLLRRYVSSSTVSPLLALNIVLPSVSLLRRLFEGLC